MTDELGAGPVAPDALRLAEVAQGIAAEALLDAYAGPLPREIRHPAEPPLAERIRLLMEWACSTRPDDFRRSVPVEATDHDELITSTLGDLVAIAAAALAAGSPSAPPADACERCDELEQDVLTAWRVRNAALAVAASFVHPGPDGADYAIRRAMVEEWVGEGHDAVKEHDRQLAEAIRRWRAAEAERDALAAAAGSPSPTPPSDGAWTTITGDEWDLILSAAELIHRVYDDTDGSSEVADALEAWAQQPLAAPAPSPAVASPPSEAPQEGER